MTARRAPDPVDACVSLSHLPVAVSGEWTYNVSPSIQDNLTTVGSRRYCVFVGAGGRPTIAAQSVGDTGWEVADLGAIDGNPLCAPVPGDGHNFLSLAVDAAGFLHVAGNHHVTALRYVRSTAPWSIHGWSRAEMVGADEDAVSYPKFFALRSGQLFFCYRDGSPGSGNLVLNRYGTDGWERMHTLVDAKSTGESFYPNHISTRDGSIHLMGVWRQSTRAASTNDCTYARSDDGGRTWRRADGTPQPVPITHANCEPVFVAAPGSGLLNGGGLEVDARGRPHGALLMNDERGTQVHHVTYDGRWSCRPVTDLGHTMSMHGGYADNAVAHPAVVTTCDGRTLIVYRTVMDGLRGSIRLVDLDERCERLLAEVDLDFWNPVFDTRALYEQDLLQMLLVRTANPHDPQLTSLDRWAAEPGVVLSLPLERVDELPRVAGGRARALRTGA